MLMNLLQGDFDFLSFLQNFLVSLPAFVVALTMHEAAHGYVAWRCGDPTARMMGRVSLNPLRHLDPMGFLFMFVAGVGWAKPVPVNPNNFKNPRRDDLKVSLAGITMNLILFVLASLAMYAFVSAALARENFSAQSIEIAYRYAYSMREYLIEAQLGAAAGYLFQFFVNLAVVDLSLAVFNLLPVPPLDGYHVLNDLILKGRRLFASRKVQQIGMLAIVALVFFGAFDKALTFVLEGAFSGMGDLMWRIARAFGAA